MMLRRPNDLGLPFGTLEVGRGYEIRSASGLDSKVFFPHIRYGNPDSERPFDGGSITLSDGDLFAPQFELDTVVSLDLQFETANTTGGAIEAYLWAATGDPNHLNDPVLPLGGDRYLLNAETSIGPIAPEGLEQFGDVGAVMAIPDDPNLVGQVVLYQWILVGPAGETAISDVFGAKILAPSFALQGGSGASTPMQAMAVSSRTAPGGRRAAGSQQLLRSPSSSWAQGLSAGRQSLTPRAVVRALAGWITTR